MRNLLIAPLIFLPAFVFSQSVGIGTSTPNSSAQLEVASTIRGLLMPRMNSGQRTSIVSPAQGLQVYDTDTNSFWYYNGSGWTELTVGGGGGTNYWSLGSGGSIYNNNPWKVMLGTSDIGPGYVNIKIPVNGTGLFLSETGTSSADFFNMAIATGAGTPATRLGIMLGNFGNGMLIVNQANAPIQFQTYNSEKMRITPTGLVGINTINPTAQLEVQTATGVAGITHTNGTVRLTTMINSATSASIGTTTNHPLFFFTNNTFPPAMTISTAGNVGVGGSLANDKLEAFTPDGSYGITHSAGGVSIGTYIGSGGGWLGTKTNNPLYLYAATGNSFIALMPDGKVGIGMNPPPEKLSVQTATNNYGLIHTDGNVTVGTYVGGNAGWFGTKSNHPLYLYASTGASYVALMQNGNLGVGTNPGNYKLKVRHGSGSGFNGFGLENANSGNVWELLTGAATGSLVLLFNNSIRGDFNSTSGAYTAVSDERLKTNIKSMSSMLEKIRQLKPSTYQFKNSEDKQEYNGFIAQDVMRLFPSLVVHNVIPERKIDVYTMDYSGFGVIAVKGIQELQEKITTLEARLARLEAVLATITANK